MELPTFQNKRFDFTCSVETVILLVVSVQAEYTAVNFYAFGN